MHSLTATFVVLGLAGLLTACGDDDDETDASRTALIAFELTGAGDEAKMSGPRSRPARCT